MSYITDKEPARTPWIVGGSNGRTITTEDERYPGDGIIADCDLRVNAVLIVTAVNHHQELVTRLYNLSNLVNMVVENSNGECPRGVSSTVFEDLKRELPISKELINKLA